jgi:NAD(P)-dependent dehydrogenase (short-subunit alcohol dehydrogenase family)
LCRQPALVSGWVMVFSIDFTSRIVVVTGGASGIGLATAKLFRECGARVVALDRANLSQQITDIEYRYADVTDRASTEAALESIETDLGAIDVLVNSAGILERALPLGQASDKEWDRVISTNLRGTYLCCRYVGLRMAERGTGAIVNVTSVMGLRASPLRAYGPSKAAVINLTEGLAAEWGSAGVRVNAIAPGFTETPAVGLAAAAGLMSVERLARTSAARRLVAAHEVANAIAFLASDLASAITGVTLPVDCGYLVAGAWDPYGPSPD